MTLDLGHVDVAPHVARLAPYVSELLAAAGRRALRVHADEVSLEHLLGACMEDEECAAHQLVVHAFADPETIDLELLALSPGTMVVSSSAALPFSPRALDALRAARGAACDAGAAEVEAAVVLARAVAALEGPLARALGDAGYSDGDLAPAGADGGAERGGGLERDGPLFRGFSDGAKRALSHANRAASSRREASIGPAQLVLSCLAEEPALGGRSGLSAVRARSLLAGHTVDPTAPAPRSIPPQPVLVAVLAAAPDGGGSLELWAASRRLGGDEVGALLERHRITAALLERAEGAFRDPVLPR